MVPVEESVKKVAVVTRERERKLSAEEEEKSGSLLKATKKSKKRGTKKGKIVLNRQFRSASVCEREHRNRRNGTQRGENFGVGQIGDAKRRKTLSKRKKQKILRNTERARERVESAERKCFGAGSGAELCVCVVQTDYLRSSDQLPTWRT